VHWLSVGLVIERSLVGNFLHMTLRVNSPDGSIFLPEMTSWGLTAAILKVRKNNPAKFHSDPI